MPKFTTPFLLEHRRMYGRSFAAGERRKSTKSALAWPLNCRSANKSGVPSDRMILRSTVWKLHSGQGGRRVCTAPVGGGVLPEESFVGNGSKVHSRRRFVFRRRRMCLSRRRSRLISISMQKNGKRRPFAIFFAASLV